jgi:hypothetical protein
VYLRVSLVVGSILTTVPASPSAAQRAPSAYVRLSTFAASLMLESTVPFSPSFQIFRSGAVAAHTDPPPTATQHICP